MREAYAGSSAEPNSAPHNRAVQVRTNVRDETLTARLMRVAQGLFGESGITKTLARKTKVSTRTVEYWRARDPASQRSMDLDAFHRLVSADVAFLDEFLDTLPAGVRDAWLRDKILEAKLAKVERALAAKKAEAAQLKLSLRNER